MVQRKLPTKLGLQADRAKRESLWQQRDVKTRGGSADLKKKMKKSRSIMRTELESTRRVNQTQLGKLPPAIACLTGAATPQKHSPVSSMAATPNYMKSTTSSDARKEQSQVSSKIPRTRSSPDISSLHRKGSSSLKLTTLCSGNKATKISATTSNLKTVRSLTKNPSFKQARTCVRKCSPVVLCENFDVQKATCSSTLKDFKFPAYLTLNPGGTESERTSAIKVCPYAYCSLNGHHHPPLPALEAFLSAKRCALKTQRGIKLGCLSPRRVKPVGVSGTDEDRADFFIEIFTKKGECTAGHRGTDGTGSFLPSADGGNEAAAAEDQGEQVLETLSDAPTCYDVDAPEIPDIGTTHLAPLSQEVKLDSEASDIDCEADHHSAPYFNYDYEYPPEIGIEPELERVEGQIIQDKFIIGSDDIGGCLNEFFVDEVSQESFNEESFFLDAFPSSDDSESNGLNESLQSLINMESSAPVKVPVEEQEPIDDDKNQILFGCDQTLETDPPIGSQFTGYHIIAEEGSSFNNRKCKSFQSEDLVAATGIQASNLDKTVISGCKAMHNSIADNVLSNQSSSDEGYQAQNELADGDHTGNTESQGNYADNFITWSLTDPAIERIVGVAWPNSTEAECHVVHKIQEENATKPETEDSAVAQATAKFKKPTEEKDELGLFNPRAPNFLPLEPEPEAEKVDLRRQELDERKNTEEWMVDYALRQAVTELGRARKRKVALLVEAFEKVMPTTKCDLPLKHTSALGHATPIQACR